MQTEDPRPTRALSEAELLLEDVRLHILAGTFFLEEHDADDLPIADRLEVAQRRYQHHA